MIPSEQTSSDARAERGHGTERPARADALRNRERLVAVARRAFTTTDDSVPLESIAREAGVGIGTLYRHFPTREALVEAVYAAELDDLVGSASGLLDQFEPDVALRVWMSRYAEFAARKRGIIDTLRAGWSSGRLVTPTTRERITAVLATFIAAGERVGALRPGIEPDDVTALLLGVFLSTAADTTPDRADRLLDLVVDGLRPRA